VAIYHHKVKIIRRSAEAQKRRSAGPSLIGSAAYRAGEKIRDEKSGQIHDYHRRKGILHSEIIAPIRAPDWVHDRSTLWNTVVATEKRKDAQMAREIMVALPAELDFEKWTKLLRGYIFEQFIVKGMIADFAIHAPSKKGNDRNYHAHILLTLRTITAEGFGKKAREWNAKSNIYQWRQTWEIHTNKALQQAGLDCRVDCRSHADKGSNREPLLHLGYQAMEMERSGGQSERGNENRAIEARNAMKLLAHNEHDELGNITENFYPMTPQQATTQLNEISNPKNNTPDLHLEKILLESVLDQQGNAALVWEERNRILEERAKTFAARQTELTRLIENAPDEKLKQRLSLQVKIESAYFSEGYNKTRSSLLIEGDPKKYGNEIATCQNMAKKASKQYQHAVSEWHSRAVRDDAYVPIDPKAAEKIITTKAAENKRRDNLILKAEKNGWDSSRIEREKQGLEKALDYELGIAFGLEQSLSLSRGR